MVRNKLTIYVIIASLSLGLFVSPSSVLAVAEGGFIEQSDATNPARPIYTTSEIAAFMPNTRTSGTFPSPYGTKFWRITLPSDCNNTSCVNHVGYSYWRTLSNDGDNLYILVGLNKNVTESVGGPTLYKLVKSTGVLTKVKSIFSGYEQYLGTEDMYFSAQQPTKLYYRGNAGTTVNLIDVLTGVSNVVLDIGTQPGLYGTNRYIWQIHTSANDNVITFTVRDLADYSYKGCGAYIASSNTYKFFPINPIYQDYDECDVDLGGNYIQIKEQTDGIDGADSRFIKVSDNSEIVLLDKNGGSGHSDNGYGFTVESDNWLWPGGARLWNFGTNPLAPGTVVTQSGAGVNCFIPYGCGGFSHLSLLNSTNTPVSTQWALASGATPNNQNDPRTNEITAFKLDGSKTALVIAPVMTNMGSSYNYLEFPFANVDSTGRYAMYTSNLGVPGGPLTAILVQIPCATGFNPCSSSGTPLVGDINGDHIINSLDWSIMNSKWFTTDANADLNHDGLVNAIDFSMLNANWFKTW